MARAQIYLAAEAFLGTRSGIYGSERVGNMYWPVAVAIILYYLKLCKILTREMAITRKKYGMTRKYQVCQRFTALVFYASAHLYSVTRQKRNSGYSPAQVHCLHFRFIIVSSIEAAICRRGASVIQSSPIKIILLPAFFRTDKRRRHLKYAERLLQIEIYPKNASARQIIITSIISKLSSDDARERPFALEYICPQRSSVNASLKSSNAKILKIS